MALRIEEWSPVNNAFKIDHHIKTVVRSSQVFSVIYLRWGELFCFFVFLVFLKFIVQILFSPFLIAWQHYSWATATRQSHWIWQHCEKPLCTFWWHIHYAYFAHSQTNVSVMFSHLVLLCIFFVICFTVATLATSLASVIDEAKDWGDVSEANCMKENEDWKRVGDKRWRGVKGIKDKWKRNLNHWKGLIDTWKKNETGIER